jgi:UDP-2-acetamido-3-amino-2,3-dideoxy-glucuronate N-acetyltransferase
MSVEPDEPARIDEAALVDDAAALGAGTVVWGLAQVREKAVVGRGCNVGRGAYLGAGVEVGDRCKIQNSALVYEPARLADGVFVGPGAILTNDLHPRAVNPDGSLKSGSDWRPVGVTVGAGASIGAGAVCVAPVEIGRWATVAAGAVVTDNVPEHALVAGVPARQIGWVGRSGVRLIDGETGGLTCPDTGEEYVEEDGRLRRVGGTQDSPNKPESGRSPLV